MTQFDGRKRVVIEAVTPQIDSGLFPIKRTVGETVSVEADVFADGHDHVAAQLLWRPAQETVWQRLEMVSLGNDRWRGEFPVTQMGQYAYTIAGHIDHFDTWRADLLKRMEAGQDIRVDLLNGAVLIEEAERRAAGDDLKELRLWKNLLREHVGDEGVKETALHPGLAALMQRCYDETLETQYEPALSVTVDRKRAGFSAWYEIFPRSASFEPGRHGTFRDCEERLDYVAGLGFDVLYLPPIHPIGRSFRKGKNNAVDAAPGDVGSPWAIGASDGGHTAIHTQLGTLAEFRSLVRKSNQLGLEIALDIAFQCSPDHPWVREHPEWFKKRADGTIQYAENPPKKYQDIYPLNFESSDWRGLWNALRDVFLFWLDKGVSIFRVDNPHTKAFPFWEWAIAEIKRDHPEALFLAEAFTRPRVMQRLAKLGFSQSYTYFTWRNTKQELTEYLEELTQSELKEYFRPSFWPNTPDILHESLQTGGRPAFISRLVLAATLSSNYGIYGPAYELCVNQPVRQGSEEYLDSEKYELKHWNTDAPESIQGVITALNRARRDNAALHTNHDLYFHATDNPQLIAYSKSNPERSNMIVTVVNLDPFHTQSGWVSLDLDHLQLGEEESFQVRDLLTGQTYLWQGRSNYVELAPEKLPAHVFRILRRVRSENDFDYYQ
ncbi:alpha-1,4-glucan--maltose-1-phosphate maltosyltransferase [Acidipila sp. 4G-K13]|uniref:Alpha-1,4-glucan:maltose-1-phosphate maltosyltransferase n=1 Tax=Paracidobacterium acidisoli TaxID=2303751 RepID=A0A372IUQ9_9BACT|nr:alpha-1,4-glucan--maltose-1-phosphate maltosyltransferase [Paracidobacterium acidisoli]MBT9329497.1 alpha-1,4-glucan--maltose-1-phosphate maltosyltransferase [Paracidobacterium acidisoli]